MFELYKCTVEKKAQQWRIYSPEMNDQESCKRTWWAEEKWNCGEGGMGGNSYTDSDGKSFADSAEKGVMEKTSSFGKLELKVIPAFTYPTTKVSPKCQQKKIFILKF